MSALPSIGTIVCGRYRIDAVLGQGGMGTVFAAFDQSTDRRVALKWMMPELVGSERAIARFVAETRAAGRIEHPNVVAVLDAGNEGGAPFLVMELLRGESLRTRLDRRPFRVEEALDLALAICAGVSEAHAESVIHRDLKPENVFLSQDRDGRALGPKVLDFGVAKLRDVDHAITRTGASLGTPGYMAPEQIGSAREADARADVYSMGVILFELLAGRAPYLGRDPVAIVREIVAGSAPPLRSLAPQVSPQLEAIVQKAMSADRDARHASMRDLARDLARVRKVRLPTAHARPKRAPAHVQPPPRRWLLAIAATTIGLSVLLVAGGVVYALWPVPLAVSSDPLAIPVRHFAIASIRTSCATRFEDELQPTFTDGRRVRIADVGSPGEISSIELTQTGPFLHQPLSLLEGWNISLTVRLTNLARDSFDNHPTVEGSQFRVRGVAHIDAWDIAHERVHVRFEDAVLINDFGDCALEGSIETR